MKHIQVNPVECRLQQAASIPETFRTEGIAYHKIDVVNWTSQYPYRPDALFAIAHQGDAVLLHYRVEENNIRATVDKDGGRVWEDSCCEFFISIDGNDNYYNIETNCIGTALLCNGSGRNNRIGAPANILNQISRWSSSGRKPFGQLNQPQKWELVTIYNRFRAEPYVPISTNVAIKRSILISFHGMLSIVYRPISIVPTALASLLSCKKPSCKEALRIPST